MFAEVRLTSKRERETFNNLSYNDMAWWQPNDGFIYTANDIKFINKIVSNDFATSSLMKQYYLLHSCTEELYLNICKAKVINHHILVAVFEKMCATSQKT